MTLEYLNERQEYGQYPPPMDIELADELKEDTPPFVIQNSDDEGFEFINNECYFGFAYPNYTGGRTEIFTVSRSCRDRGDSPIPPPPPTPEKPLTIPPPQEGCTITAWNCLYIRYQWLPDGSNIDPSIPPTSHDGLAPQVEFEIEGRFLNISAPGNTEKIDLLSFEIVEENGELVNVPLGTFRETFFVFTVNEFFYRQIFIFWIPDQGILPSIYFWYDYNYFYGWEFNNDKDGSLQGYQEFCNGSPKIPAPRKRFPPPPRECRCMCNCSSPNGQRKQENDNAELRRLLRLILDRIGEPTEATLFDINTGQKGAQPKKIRFGSLFDAARVNVWRTEITNASIGIDTFPIDAPETTVLPEKSGIFAKIFEHLKPEKRQRIDSLAELILWIEEQNSSRDGQWHQSLAITNEGAVTEKIVLSDAASTLKEIFVLTHNLASSLNLLSDIAMKGLSEATAARTEASKAWIVARDIQEYLDYPTKELTHNVPIGISPFKYSRSGPNSPEIVEPQDDIELLLQPGEAKIKSDEWTGERSLNDVLIEVLQAVATIRAAFYQRT